MFFFDAKFLASRWPRFATKGGGEIFIVHVHVHVKPEFADAFRQATLENARNSAQEPGVARFDVIQQPDLTGFAQTFFEQNRHVIALFRRSSGTVGNLSGLKM